MNAQAGTPASEDRSDGVLAFALGRVAAGDHSALEDVYRRTSSKLFAVCVRILPDRADAEEALQDVYVSVWRNAASYDAARAAPLPWLASIARNRAIDRLRAQWARATAPLDAAGGIADPAPEASARLIAEEDAVRLVACLDDLREEEADLIRTAFLEGATYPDLAASRSLPLGTVKTRIRRALLKLRACLA